MTMTQQPNPVAPEGYTLKKSKPIYKRVWFLALLAVVVIAIFASVSAGGSDSSGSASGSNTGTGAAADVPASDVPADDPLSDGGWTASDIQVERTQFGDSVTARLTNTQDSTEGGVFTLTVFGPDGTRLDALTGAANEVEAGQAATVTFIGTSTTQSMPGDAASYTYELQNNF